MLQSIFHNDTFHFNQNYRRLLYIVLHIFLENRLILIQMMQGILIDVHCNKTPNKLVFVLLKLFPICHWKKKVQQLTPRETHFLSLKTFPQWLISVPYVQPVQCSSSRVTDVTAIQIQLCQHWISFHCVSQYSNTRITNVTARQIQLCQLWMSFLSYS